jgi:hypothetical protein
MCAAEAAYGKKPTRVRLVVFFKRIERAHAAIGDSIAQARLTLKWLGVRK